MTSQNITEYNGFSIQIGRTPIEIMTGERYWIFNVWRTRHPPFSVPNGKQYGGYEVALAEAKKFIDDRNINFRL